MAEPRALVVEDWPIADLIPYARNARTHSDEQVAQIAASIREFGWTNPVLVDEEGGIIAGHGRVLAARQLKIEHVPCIVIEGLSEAQKRAYTLADNKLALNAGWNLELLQVELKDLDGAIDLSVIGFSPDELETLIGKDAPVRDGKTDEDEVPEPTLPLVSETGNVWICGRHRVMCGDAREVADAALLMAGETADLVWTDPPYNVAYEGAAGSIQGDDETPEQFEDDLRRAFGNALRAMRPGACIYVSHADTSRLPFTRAYQASGLKLSQVLIWVKNAATLSRQDYNWRHEPILYGWKEGAAHYFCGDFKKTTVTEEPEDWEALKKDDLIARCKALQAAIAQTTLRHDKPAKSELHPTMKPVALVRECIEASSLDGQRVLDLYGGSGSTLIAAERTGRQARILEIDPKYVDVIVRRWQEFTGKKATLEGDGRTFGAVAAQRSPVQKGNGKGDA